MSRASAKRVVPVSHIPIRLRARAAPEIRLLNRLSIISSCVSLSSASWSTAHIDATFILVMYPATNFCQQLRRKSASHMPPTDLSISRPVISLSISDPGSHFS